MKCIGWRLVLYANNYQETEGCLTCWVRLPVLLHDGHFGPGPRLFCVG